MSKHQIYTTSSVTLHVSVWVEINSCSLFPLAISSRSTWACELKYTGGETVHSIQCHAPRERVSWNLKWKTQRKQRKVTLHVSVWVEIYFVNVNYYQFAVTLHEILWVEISTWLLFGEVASSRSTWACELKCKFLQFNRSKCSHAPRERVSWNYQLGLFS